MLVGVISDTHGLLRNEALTALAGCQYILHAGDVGDPAILTRLRDLAPVSAIRGNIDVSGPCADLPSTEMIDLEGTLIYVLHALADLDLKPSAAGIRVVISGHSHKPSVDTRDGVLYLNPGSAGPRRFSLPVTVALLTVLGGNAEARIVPILPSPDPGRGTPS